MKNAIEFVKEFGLDSFKAAMICPQFKRYDYAILYSDEVDFSNKFIEKHADYMLKTSDIKRLAESHELANRLGGVDTMRIMIEQMEINDLCDGMNISFDGEWQGVFTKGQLQQAIADMESCQ